jgi:lactoylglutathione lyase
LPWGAETLEIDYIALFVTDVEHSLQFYRDVLGFEFPKPQKRGGVEGYSGCLKVGLYDRSWLPQLFGERGHVPISGQPFLLSMTVDDLDAIYAQLLTQGVTPLSPPQQMEWGQRILFLTDPDGNLLEIVEKMVS